MTLAAGLILLLFIALVYSVAQGTQVITSRAETLHDADEALRAATVVRAQLGLAAYAGSVDAQFGADSTLTVATGVREAADALAITAAGVQRISAEDGISAQLDGRYEEFSADAGAVTALLEYDPQAALRTVSTRLDGSFTALTDQLVVVRDALADEVSASDRFLGSIGTIAGFLIAVAIPAAVILFYRELSRRQARQNELEIRLEAERQVNQAREEFIASASHELKNPLTGITGMAYLLDEDPALHQSDIAPELLDAIISETNDLGRLVEDLLTTARLNAGAMHYVFEDVEVAAEVGPVLAPFARRGLVVKNNAVPSNVRVDRLRFRQILRNLVSNAEKYGGQNIRIEGTPRGDTYELTIIDNGDGVPESVADSLFDRYVHQGKGTGGKQSVGLGLSIVMALAVGMGGTVYYARKDGETRFSVVMPLAAAASVDERLSAPELAAS